MLLQKLTALLAILAPLGLCYAQAPADRFYDAIRNARTSDLQQLIKTSDINSKDAKGSTPLMYAAAYGTLDAVKLLLNSGAEVNACNGLDETALMWSATEFDKVKLLISRGAAVDARSKQGRTALFLAAAKDGNVETVKLLLAHGADAAAADSRGVTPLAAAANANDLAIVQLLASHGASINTKDAVGWTPLMSAAANGNPEMIRLFLAKGADVNAVTAKEINPPVKHGAIQIGLETPLLLAAATANAGCVRQLLAAGATVNAQDVRGLTPLMTAIATDHADPAVVKLLLQYGADRKVKDLSGQVAAVWARKFNAPAILQALGIEAAPAIETASKDAAAGRGATQAAEAGISLLQRTGGTFLVEGGCASCHSHNLAALAVNGARAKGLRVDSSADAGAGKANQMMWMYFAPMLLQRMDPPGGADMLNYGLLDIELHAPDTRTTDPMIHNLLASQRQEGNWHFGGLARPPISDGDFSRTALAIRVLQRFGPEGRRVEVEHAIAAAAEWLASAEPVTTEDRNMQLLGLKWAGKVSAKQQRLINELLALQKDSGGWAQTPNLAADAYATGQALFTLHELGVPPGSTPIKRGMEYLLRTQAADGSWHVKTRAAAIQPYFESGFPYGHDQWISSSGTSWAALALTYAVPPQISSTLSR